VSDRAEVPDEIVARLRTICLALPECSEEQAWTGTRWCVRKKNFAHVIAIDEGWPPAYARAAGTDGPATVLTFRSAGTELDALSHAGHPFFRPVWFPDIVGMVVDAGTDWGEIAELVTESYRVLAPPKLAALIDRPAPAGPGLSLRPAEPADAHRVADIWRRGWHDGHSGNVPDDLVAARTDASFTTRAAERIGDTTVAVVDNHIAGFVMVVDDEVEQVYVDDRHRGTDVASTLLAEAERTVAANGHTEAWLAVVAGNTRARRFYERCGWRDDGLFDHRAPGEAGAITVPAHRYVKRVVPSPPPW
jgi:GNAT superfamily N-acetyltransferase